MVGLRSLRRPKRGFCEHRGPTGAMPRREGAPAPPISRQRENPGLQAGIPSLLQDSQHERLVAVFLNDCGIEYTVHPDIGGLGYEAEFCLPEPNLWVEVDGYVGGGRPNAANTEAKREYSESNGLDHVVVENSTKLEEELRKRGALPEQRS